MSTEKDAFAYFLARYPSYKDTMVIDSLRREEYPHLDKRGQSCLDYAGVGLFSCVQKSLGTNGAFGIGLSHTSGNLATHAMYTEEGSTESLFRRRILKYLNLDEDDYYLVFTANAFSAFKLLGESYPFHESQNLLLAYDHHCENVDAISKCACARWATVQSAALSFPSCKVDVDDLWRKLQCKRKMHAQRAGIYHNNKGLFAFPYSSRVTGCQNSSRWIAEAQRDGWHVLLDMTSVDTKMLGTLGLSLFLPDFVICSFYHVFGEDPTGFGCLAIKKSGLRTLGDSSRARAIGMVTIVPRITSLNSRSSIVAGDEEKGDASMEWHGSSPPYNFASFSPECSADIMELDKSVFYQLNGNGSTTFNALTCQEGKALAKGKWPYIHNGDMNVSNGRKVISSDSTDSKETTGEGVSQRSAGHRTTSFSSWLTEQVLPTDRLSRLRSSRESWHGKSLSFSNTWHNHGDFGPDNMVVGTSWKHRSCGPSPKRTLKGLFYGNMGTQHDPEWSPLRRQQTKSSIATKLQSISQLSSGEMPSVNDWANFYSNNAKVWRSGSCNTSSSASPSRRPELDDKLVKEVRHPMIMGCEVECRGLDHADMLGYKRIAVRLRSLTNWLISSLLRLQHPPPECSKLVKICSQILPADRGSTVAFTLLDTSGKTFDLKRVQLLADRNNISLRMGVIEGFFNMEQLEKHGHGELAVMSCVEFAGYGCRLKEETVQMLQLPVLYVSLGFLNNFSDVYRLWVFISKFLDPQFVQQELWHYQALNQQTIEI